MVLGLPQGAGLAPLPSRVGIFQDGRHEAAPRLPLFFVGYRSSAGSIPCLGRASTTKILNPLFVVLSLSLFGAGVAIALDSSPAAVPRFDSAQGEQDPDKRKKKDGKKKARKK